MTPPIGGNVPVTGIAVADITVNKGDSVPIAVTFTPSDATNQGWRWEQNSDNGHVLIDVDDQGNATGVYGGTGNLTVISEDGELEATAAIRVLNPVPVTGMTLTERDGSAIADPIPMNLVGTGGNAHKEKYLLMTLSPTSPTDATFRVVIADNASGDIVMVRNAALNTSTGEIDVHLTAQEVGTGTVTFFTNDGNFSASVNISITAT
nr:Ig-like domain-containing protein [Kosakonia sacchari]